MFNRSEILKAAWAQCKAWYLHRGRTFRFVRAEFQWALRCAWHDARVAVMTETEKRIDQIERALATLAYSGSASNAAYATSLRAELAALIA